MLSEESDEGLHSKSNITSGFYDAMLLYAHAVGALIDDRSVLDNQTVSISSFDVLNQMWGRTYMGKSPTHSFNESLSPKPTSASSVLYK